MHVFPCFQGAVLICPLVMSQMSTNIISTFIMNDTVNAVKQQP